MAERTLRYPGHIELMKTLRDAGFFSQQEIELKTVKVKPIEVTNAPLEEKDQLRFCDFLISNDRIKEAKSVWHLWRKNDLSLIDDRGFEAEPLNTAFGWRFQSKSGFYRRAHNRVGFFGQLVSACPFQRNRQY